MKLPRRKFLHLAAGAAALPALSRVARAQTYPSRPITLIVAFAAGGPQDNVARTITEKMRGVLGQPVIVENIVGASGTIGVGRAARATPDGHTLCTGSVATHVFNGALFSLQYDLVKDFEPISLTAGYSLVIIARKSMPARDLKEMISWLKENPDKASAGNSGAGTPAHLAGILFQKMTGTRFQSVPYRGNNPAMQDLISGHIDFMITDPTVSVPQVKAGTIKAFAVAGSSRLASISEIPTVDEAGLPGFHMGNWNGVFAPKGTPTDVISKINAALSSALADPTISSRLATLGLEVFPPEQRTPDALAALQKAEIEKWWPIIKAGGIKVE